jgi:hypothetical protein
LGGKCAEDCVNFLGALAVTVGMSIDENRLRAELGRGAQGHGGVDSELAGGVGGGGDYAAFVALSADDDGLAFQGGIEEFFHRDEEGVHVDVEDGAGEGGLVGGSHAKGILAAVATESGRVDPHAGARGVFDGNERKGCSRQPSANDEQTRQGGCRPPAGPRGLGLASAWAGRLSFPN